MCDWGDQDVVLMGCGHVNETVMFESVTYKQGGSRMMRITTCERVM